ncbi:MAG: APC family permease [Alphaproteobacteria bacterium]|nr:APC family permease [Alphaproteobacteria bacterium]
MSEQAGLRAGALGLVDCIGQSVASIGPTLTPAINIALVAGLAGNGSWLSFLVATVGMMFVAFNISTLSHRHTLSGSYFLYIGRTAGPLAGLVSGWLLIGAYLMMGVAISFGFLVFLQHFLDAVGLVSWQPDQMLTVAVLVASMTLAAWGNVRFSARLGLALEALSLIILAVVTTVVVMRSGRIVDTLQLDFGSLRLGGIMTSLTFAVFCFVGFESAATLARETRNPRRNVPLAVTVSTLLSGLFFVAIAYFMVLGFDDNAAAIADSASPLTEMARRAGLSAAAGVLYFGALISSCACLLASLNAVSRLLFSMARYAVLPRRLAAVHPRHRTPYVGIALSAVMVLALSLALLPLGNLEAFGDAGALATFGFLAIYFLICIAAPLDQHAAGTLALRHLLASGGGVLMMTFVIFGSVYPVPPWPQNLLPYLFAGYTLLGTVWCHLLLRRRSGLGKRLQLDLEG